MRNLHQLVCNLVYRDTPWDLGYLQALGTIPGHPGYPGILSIPGSGEPYKHAGPSRDILGIPGYLVFRDLGYPTSMQDHPGTFWVSRDT